MSARMTSVLILDDHDAIRESLMAFFEDRGWEVFAAETAEEALELLGEEHPDGVTVDIRLPGMNGYDCLRAMVDSGKNLPCVIITGSPEFHLPDDVAAMPNIDANVFVKPVSDMQLLELALLKKIEDCKGEIRGAGG